MFLLHFLKNINHYLPFPTLRHGVANFSVLHKIHFATSCRKVFPCQFSKLHFCMELTLRHRVVKFPPAKSQKNISAWNPLCDIVSQSSSLTYSKKNSFPVYSSCRSPSTGSGIPSAASSLPSTSYKSNSSFILIFNWCFIYASTSKAFFLS